MANYISTHSGLEIDTAVDHVGSAVEIIQIGETQYRPTGADLKVTLPTYPTTLPASDTVDTYSATDDKPISGKGVAIALQQTLDGLDYNSVGGTGKYIQAISETNGIISAIAQDMPTELPASDTVDTYSASSEAPISGKGVAAAITSLNLGQYVKNVTLNGTSVVSNQVAILPTSLPASDVTDTFSASGHVPVSGTAVAAGITSYKNVANGIAGLNASGIIDDANLPTSREQINSYSTIGNFPSTGERKYIYHDINANKDYIWNGTAYTEISLPTEHIRNKVLTISAASTDEQYPTAKAVYDIVGNIESALEGLL